MPLLQVIHYLNKTYANSRNDDIINYKHHECCISSAEIQFDERVEKLDE